MRFATSIADCATTKTLELICKSVLGITFVTYRLQLSNVSATVAA
jgi:hypothetical protein